MKFRSICTACVFVMCVTAVYAEPDSDVSKASIETMEEWNDWKFGMFIHWGAWSQTEIGAIWHMWREDTPEQRAQRFKLNETFNPVKFDATEWARMAKAAGMKYLVFTTKHHDGFCNWDTKLTGHSVTDPACPYSKSPNPDIVKNLVEAYRKEGLGIGFYYSHIDWHHPQAMLFSETYLGGKLTREQREKARTKELANVDSRPEDWKEFVQFEKGQVRELLTNYGEIDILWFDIWWPSGGYSVPIKHPKVKDDMVDLLKMARGLQPGIIINNRGTDFFGDFETPEQKIPEGAPSGYWETNMTMTDPYRRHGGGYWYKGSDAPAKSMDELLNVMVKVFSKGGNFLLNVGPAPDGTFPKAAVSRLKDLGSWMNTNSEAVYGSKRNPLGENPDWGYITRKDQNLYLFVFDWPKKGEKITLAVPGKIKSARLLKGNKSVTFSYDSGESRVEFTLPNKPPHPIASVIAIEVESRF